MSTTNEARGTGYMSENTGYLNDSFTMMRIDARQIIAELEGYYRGKRLTHWRQSNDQYEPVYEKLGEPLMNTQGIQYMMSVLTSLFNPQTVQGNMTDIDIANYLANVHLDLATNLMDKAGDFNISDSDYNTIIDHTMWTAEMFFSRTKDNLERESYAQTHKSVETMQEKQGGFSFNPFK